MRGPSPNPFRAFAVLTWAMLSSSAVVTAQCTYAWIPAAFGSGSAGSFGSALRASALAVMQGGDVVVAGYAAAPSDHQVARWNGTTWNDLGPTMNNEVQALIAMPDGSIVAGGSFTAVGGVAIRGIARWNGTAWVALGGGLGSVPGSIAAANVAALALLPNGDLIAAGTFASIGGVSALDIARWDGTAWSPLGAGIGSGGPFGVSGSVTDVAVTPNGEVIAVGAFTNAGAVSVSNIARWNGTTWSALGSGLGALAGRHVVAMPNGDLVASGPFASAGGVPVNWIARWDGSAWSSLGNGLSSSQTSLLALPNGELLVGSGPVLGGQAPIDNLLRWDGSTWSVLPNAPMTLVGALALRPLGGVIAAGVVWLPGGGFAPGRLELLASSCSGTALAYGVGCAGSGGVNTLTPVVRPDLGATFQSESVGMPASGLVLAVYGFAATSVPLSQLLPAGVPGCTLLASADFVDAMVPVAGAATSRLPIPTAGSLSGMSLFHQHVALEIGAAQQLVAVTGTNGLNLTIGTF